MPVAWVSRARRSSSVSFPLSVALPRCLVADVTTFTTLLQRWLAGVRLMWTQLAPAIHTNMDWRRNTRTTLHVARPVLNTARPQHVASSLLSMERQRTTTSRAAALHCGALSWGGECVRLWRPLLLWLGLPQQVLQTNACGLSVAQRRLQAPAVPTLSLMRGAAQRCMPISPSLHTQSS